MITSTKKQSSCTRVVHRFDVFGYSEPVDRTRSYAGALISLASFSLLIASFIAAVNNVNENVSTISGETHGMSKDSGTMPSFAVAFARDMKHVAYNHR